MPDSGAWYRLWQCVILLAGLAVAALSAFPLVLLAAPACCALGAGHLWNLAMCRAADGRQALSAPPYPPQPLRITTPPAPQADGPRAAVYRLARHLGPRSGTTAQNRTTRCHVQAADLAGDAPPLP